MHFYYLIIIVKVIGVETNMEPLASILPMKVKL